MSRQRCPYCEGLFEHEEGLEVWQTHHCDARLQVISHNSWQDRWFSERLEIAAAMGREHQLEDE